MNEDNLIFADARSFLLRHVVRLFAVCFRMAGLILALSAGCSVRDTRHLDFKTNDFALNIAWIGAQLAPRQSVKYVTESHRPELESWMKNAKMPFFCHGAVISAQEVTRLQTSFTKEKLLSDGDIPADVKLDEYVIESSHWTVEELVKRCGE